MQWSAQIVSALAGVLLVIPMYFLGKQLFGKTVGFWGALLFQCMPVSGHILSDAVSESLCLCCSAWALWLGMLAVRGNSIWPYGLCGLLTGMAYLVRPEGLLVLPAVGCVMLVSNGYLSWKHSLKNGCGLALSFLIVTTPFMLAIGGITNKPSAQYLSGEDGMPGQVPSAGLADRHLFAVRIDADGTFSQRMIRGARGVLDELIHTFHYWGALPLLLGVWIFRERIRKNPSAWVLMLLFLFHGGLVWWLAVKRGYVSDRNVLVLVMTGIFLSVATMVKCGQWVKLPKFGLVLVLTLLVLAGLVKTVQPLHANRAGHHAAGRWLASHVPATSTIVDDHCWARFYANRLSSVHFMDNTISSEIGYVVISRVGKRGDPTTRRLIPEEELRARGGRVVFHWPRADEPDQAQVLIYELPGSGKGKGHPPT